MQSVSFANTTGLPAIGVIASKTRRQPGRGISTLQQLLDKHRATFENSFVFCTWGTYHDVFLDARVRESKGFQKLHAKDQLDAFESRKKRWETGLLWAGPGHSLRPGKRAGMIEMAELLEGSNLKSNPDFPTALVFLAAPEDVEESFPEDRALLRSAIRNNVTFLMTYRAAALWAAYEVDPRRRSGAKFVPRSKPAQETLALIAHDGKKLDMCEWVVRHRRRLAGFSRFVTTGTTGEWVKRFLVASGVSEQKIALVDRKESGPSGGDIQIASEIFRGHVHHMVFFIDPMTPHAHEADIQALLRTCALPKVHVNVRLTERAATSWIETIPEAKGPL
jgi:methylglyoxal synthase